MYAGAGGVYRPCLLALRWTIRAAMRCRVLMYTPVEPDQKGWTPRQVKAFDEALRRLCPGRWWRGTSRGPASASGVAAS